MEDNQRMISHGKELVVFAGNSNPILAKNICSELKIPLGNSSISHFADGECSVSIYEPVRGKDVFIVQSTCNPVNDNLMELLIMIDAMRRASAGRITAVIPYFGYARQDRKAKSRDPISAKLVANLITVAGADRVLTMDLHAAQIQGFFDIPVDNLVGSYLFIKHFTRLFGKGNEDVMVVSMNIIGNVEGKICILLDDIIDPAGSLCGAAKALMEIGGAKEVYACVTHGVLSGPALQRLEESAIKELLLLDTIPYPKDKPLLNKISYISTAQVYAEAIHRIYEEISIANMFEA